MRYTFYELGYFTEDTCKKIKKAMDGKTYMDFNVTWSNHAGNCTLIVDADYADTEAKHFFVYAALNELAKGVK